MKITSNYTGRQWTLFLWKLLFIVIYHHAPKYLTSNACYVTFLCVWAWQNICFPACSKVHLRRGNAKCQGAYFSLADKISESTACNLRIPICMMLIQHMKAALAQTELSACFCMLGRTECDLDKKKLLLKKIFNGREGREKENVKVLKYHIYDQSARK